MENLLKIADLTKEEITDILNTADQLKFDLNHQIPHPYLNGKTLGMIFHKVSTRTRVSFETGMYQLGGQALFLSADDLQIERGETVADTARTLSRYVDGIMIRTFNQSDIEEFSKYSTVPVINGLTDYSHPCQVLADLLTIREYKNVFEGLKLCYIGDGNNMANSTIVGALKVGMQVEAVCPPRYMPSDDVLDFAKGQELFTLTDSIEDAVKDADVVVTDSWYSMGREAEKEQRIKDFKGYTVTTELLKLAKDDCIVLHCLPAHKGNEITEEAFEAHANEIFDEAENRLHAQKAVLVKLLANR
jgi:ornithine carbamoyltransferase